MNNPRPRRRRLCNCDKCAGKEIPERTWYTHNPKETRRRPFQLPQEMIDVILRQPETNILPPWARKRKRQLDEEVEATPHTSERAPEPGSGSVCFCAWNTPLAQAGGSNGALDAPASQGPLFSAPDISSISASDASARSSGSNPSLTTPTTPNDTTGSGKARSTATTSGASQNALPARSSRKKKDPKPRKMFLSKQLCHNDWKKTRPAGTLEEYESYWAALGRTTKNKYMKAAKELEKPGQGASEHGMSGQNLSD